MMLFHLQELGKQKHPDKAIDAFTKVGKELGGIEIIEYAVKILNCEALLFYFSTRKTSLFVPHVISAI